MRGTAGQEKGRSVKRCCTSELGRGLCDHLVPPESKHTLNLFIDFFFLSHRFQMVLKLKIRNIHIQTYTH